MLVVLINNINKCANVCSLCFNSKCVYVRNQIAAAHPWGPEVSIYGQICIRPTWQPTRLVSPIAVVYLLSEI